MPAGIPPWKKLALKYLSIESNESFIMLLGKKGNRQGKIIVKKL
jgi:hypothetical protein